MLIKELYPSALKIDRDEKNALQPFDADAFESAKSEFEDKFILQGKLQKSSGLMDVTVNIWDMYEENMTMYMVMACDGGLCYNQFSVEEETPEDAIRRTIAAADVVKQIHIEGYLYLDLKPHNLLIFPEKPDRVILFDYDSCTPIPPKEMDRISCSYGFSAPELRQGLRDRISVRTDIYSVGALLFSRLLGRTAVAADREYGVKYNFDTLRERYKTLSPRFFRKLEDFFHKTLSATPELRFSKMTEVIDCLKELLGEADPGKTYVLSNFSYVPVCFTGRDKELAEIEERLRINKYLFIHGLPGIGKTELASNYMFSKYEKDRCFVLHWRNSIRQTLMSEDVSLVNFAREEGQSDDDFYKEKKNMLKALLGKDDIVLLVNFDKPEDPDMEYLLSLNCKLLITTRLDFGAAFDDPQMELKPFSNGELVELFLSYSEEHFSPEEEAKVRELIEYVERHTMTVELLAKYIKAKHGFISPGELLAQMRENEEGLSRLSPTLRIEHQKDGRRETAPFNQHLLKLFDVTNLSDNQKSLLRGLTLFGNVRITVKLLFSLFGWSNDGESADVALNHLNELISYGWVQKKDNKVFLHQVILDLMYDHLNPTEDNCGQLMDGLLRYLKSVPEMNSVEKFAARRLLYNVHSRLKDKDKRMIEFAMEFLGCFQPDWEDLHSWETFHPVEVEQLRAVIDGCEELCLKDEASHFSELAELYALKVRRHESLLLRPDFEKEQSDIQNVQKDCDAAVEYAKQAGWSVLDNGSLHCLVARCFDLAAEFCGDSEQGCLLDNAGAHYQDAVKMLEEANAPVELLCDSCKRASLFFRGAAWFSNPSPIRTEVAVDIKKAVIYYIKENYYKLKAAGADEKVNRKLYNEMIEQLTITSGGDCIQEIIGFKMKIKLWQEQNYKCTDDKNLILRCFRAGFWEKFYQIFWSFSISPYTEALILYFRRDGLLDEARQLCRACIEKQTAVLQWSKGSTANNTARLLLNVKYHYMQLTEDASEREAIHDELLALYARYIEPSALTGVVQEFVYELALQAEDVGRLERAEELFLRALDVPLPDCEIQAEIVKHLLALAKRYNRSEKKASLLLKAAGPLARNGSGRDVKTLCRAIEEDIRSGKLSEPYLEAQTYCFLGRSCQVDLINARNQFIDDGDCWQYQERCDYGTLAGRKARHADRWHAVVCWRQAASLYESVRNEEKAADCRERALDFWTPQIRSKVKAAPSHSLASATSYYSFDIGIHSDNLFDFSIENYLTETYKLISYSLTAQDNSKAEALMRKIPEIVAGYLVSSNDNCLNCDLDRFYKMMMILWNKVGDPVQACVSWMKWIILKSDPSMKEACAVLLYNEKETEGKFLEILSSEPSQELIDLIIPDLDSRKSVWPSPEGRIVCELFLETHRDPSIEVKSRTRTSVSGAGIS